MKNANILSETKHEHGQKDDVLQIGPNQDGSLSSANVGNLSKEEDEEEKENISLTNISMSTSPTR